MEAVKTKIHHNSSLMTDFKAFVLRGNVIDLAIGIVIGAAFGSVVLSFVKDILMPPIGLLLGGVDFSNLFVILKYGTTPGPYYTIDQAQRAGAVTLNIGLFINVLITFIIIAFAVFMLVRIIKNMEKKEEVKAETVKKCPYCLTTNDIHATRCAHCTSQIGAM